MMLVLRSEKKMNIIKNVVLYPFKKSKVFYLHNLIWLKLDLQACFAVVLFPVVYEMGGGMGVESGSSTW